MDYNPFETTKVDRSSPASRQKSCNACVRGKRRCDKRTPRCTRCAAKGLDCIYQRLPPSENSPPHGSSNMGMSASASVAAVTAEDDDVPDFVMSFDLDPLGPSSSSSHTTPDLHATSSASTTTATSSTSGATPDSGCLPTPSGSSLHANTVDLHLDPNLSFDINDLLNAGAVGGGADLWGTTSFQGIFGAEDKLNIPPVPVMPPRTEPTRDLSLLSHDECPSLDPIEVHDPRSKIGNVVKFVTEMHETFARTRATAFMHPRLWASSTPRSILAAFSAASAYAGRTADTRAWVLRLLTDSVREVQREGERASTFQERLARVQALLLLDSIRMLDGDVATRAAAEREQEVLCGWLKDLLEVRDELHQEHNTCARDKPPQSWESWILAECVNRTVIFGLSFTFLMSFLKSENLPTDCEMFPGDNIFTASRSLWEAQSSVEFFRAWRERPLYVIRNFVFNDFWQFARPDDLDEFTKVFLATQVGLNAVEHFITGEPYTAPVVAS